jgi:type II restriction enzyme
MKQLNFYYKHQLNTPNEVFDYLVNTILLNNRTWEYFINWDKVFKNVSQYKIELNILNSLCGSKDFDNELIYILQNYPEVIKVLPTLMGIRDKKINVLDSSVLPDFQFKEFDFGNSDLFSNDIDNYVLFFVNSGLKKLIIDGGLTNIKDYTYGVEVGLDTNGRKNRGGTIMEDLVNDLFQKVYGLDESTYIIQGSPSRVKDLWGVDLPVDKSSRRPDFLVYRNNKVYWIETNFYNGGGSKLKSTCGEYKSLYDFCSNNGVEFIWITDGEGWKTTLKPLEETFLHNDYIFNLSMVKDGILNDLWG